jgi:4-hydroxybenzoate polyprenyltransferase
MYTVKKLNSFIRLMRFDKPIGIFLLWWPTAWALWLASPQGPQHKVLMYFIMGTILMRAAGCIINDLADRNIDGHVLRTRQRPLPQKEVNVVEAVGLCAILLGIALYILLQLPYACIPCALLALSILVIYPFSKRFFSAPQLFLGIAFSMGIPMAYCAQNAPFTLSMVILFLINFYWTNAYDTSYAMVDRRDDLKLGVKSTAILFGSWDVFMISFLQILSHLLWLVLAVVNSFNLWFYLCWSLSIFLLVRQYLLIKDRQPNQCFKAFLESNWYGLVMWVGLIGGR